MTGAPRWPAALAVLALLACADPNSGGELPPGTYDTGGSATPDSGGSSGASSSGASSSGASSSGGLPGGEPVEVVTNTAYYENALQLINTTRKRLDIVQFEVHQEGSLVAKLIAAIEQAHARGVKVRVLFDDEIPDNEVVRKRLADKGIAAKIDSKARRTHCKLIYADDAFVVGSTNWSQTSITKNNEANLLVRHPLSRKRMGVYIDKLWENSSAPIATTLSSSKIGALYTDGGYRAVVTKLIQKAQEHIEIVSYGMNLDPKYTSGPVRDTAKLLGDAIQRGVKVRVILDQSPWSKTTTALNKTALAELAKLGVAAGRLDDPDRITHAKVFIADDAAVLGTNNWGKGGFEDYHEAGLRTYESDAVAELLSYFQSIWDKSK